jgi:hypothetical protein
MPYRQRVSPSPSPGRLLVLLQAVQTLQSARLLQVSLLQASMQH